MNYYKEIKEKIKDNEIYERVKDYSKERHRVLTYFEIGKLLYEAGKHYGESVISKYAISLEKEFGKKYDKFSLYRMRQFYLLFSNQKWSTLKGNSTKTLYYEDNINQKWSTPSNPDQIVATPKTQSSNTAYNKGNLNQKVATPLPFNQKTSTTEEDTSANILLMFNLTWSHYKEILSISNINEVLYYINTAKTNHLSVRELRNRIKTKEYYRIDEKTRNKIIKYEDTSALDYVKNPILIKNNNNYDDISEKLLQRLILEDLQSFLKELGDGFCYIGNEYKIVLGDRYNYIDLLLFNIEYNCYVVVELKTTELKKEHIGQIELYMNYIDKNIKKVEHEKTVGIIICKKDNKFVIEYCSDKRITTREYKLI